uniref:DUF4198 domain-containing protein n=1 Tax=Streptomyces sp. NBC_00003 TaxID=2903608 RepID=A0AAU2VF28_9ACTN
MRKGRRQSTGLRRAARACLVAGLLGLSAGGVSAAAADTPRLTYFSSLPRIEVGGDVEFNAWDVPAGTDKVTVTSPALAQPIPLAPVEKGSHQFVQADRPGEPPYEVRGDISPGSYPATATVEGRVIATTRLTVVARGRVTADKFVIRPTDAPPCTNIPAPVRPGGDVKVLIADRRLGLDDDRLTIESPVFKHPLTVEKDADNPGCMGDDGAVVYGGHATLRDDIPEGQYAMTVVGRHRHQDITQQVTVAGRAVSRNDRSWLTSGAIAAGILALAAAGFILWRRRRTAAASS